MNCSCASKVVLNGDTHHFCPISLAKESYMAISNSKGNREVQSYHIPRKQKARNI